MNSPESSSLLHRRRLPIYVAGAFVLFSGASAFWRYWQELDSVESRAYAQVEYRMSSERANLELLLNLQQDDLLPEELARFDSMPEVAELALVDASGNLVYSSQSGFMGETLAAVHPDFTPERLLSARQNSGLAIDFDARKQFLLAYQPLASEGLASGKVLLLKYDLSPLKTAARQKALAFVRMELGVGFGLLIGLLLILRRPLAELAAAVAEKERASISMRESEETFRTLVEGTLDLITRVDTEGRFVFVNNAAKRIFGIEPIDCIGLSAFDFIHPADRESSQNAFDEWIESQEHSLSFENRQVGLNGTVHRMQWNIMANRNAAGDIVGFSSIARDITLLHEQKRLLDDSQLIAHVGSWKIELSTGEMTLSEETFRLFDLSPISDEPPTIDTFADLFFTDDRAGFQEWLESLRAKESPSGLEVRGRALDGEIRWLMVNGVLETGPNAEPKRLLGTIQDVTDRRLTNEELRESEDKLRKVVDGFGPNVFVGLLTPEGRVLMANESALSASGLELDDVLGQLVEETPWFDYSKEAKERMRAVVQLAAEGKSSRMDIQIRGVEENSFIWIELSINPVSDETGKVAYLVPSSLVIQERKLAEEKLLQSEENLSITLQSIGDAVIATDSSGCVTRMNKTAERLTGWPVNEALGKPLVDVFNIIHAQTRATAVNPVQQVMEHGQVVGLANHTALLARDGHEYQIADSAAPIRNSADEIVGVVLVFSDVTEKYRIEEDLRRAEETFRRTFKITPNSLTLQSKDGVMLDCSDVFCQVTGYAREEVIGRNAQELGLWVNSEQRAEMRSVLQRDGQVDDFVFHLRRRDGEIRTMLISARYLPMQKEPVLLSVAYDITESTRMEQLLAWEKSALELLATTDSLTDVLEMLVVRFEAHLPQALCSVLLLDADGIHLRHGAAPSLPSGYNRVIDGAAIGPRSGSCGTAAYLNRQVIVEDIATDPLWTDYRDIALEHDLHACWSTPIPSSSGKVLGTFAIYYREPRHPEKEELDLIDRAQHLVGLAIERERSAQEKADIEAQLIQSQKLEALGTLAGGIAHDFNNILAAITGFTSLARQIAGENAEQLDYFDELDRAGSRAASLVEQILAFSRVENHVMVPVQMRPIVEEALQLLRATIPSSIKFNVNLATELPTVLGGATQLHQVLMNLGTNARHAIQDEGGELSFDLEARVVADPIELGLPELSPGTFVVLSVSDTGSGMDEATMKRVFEPFFTTKAPGKGTGLGLSVLHGIVRSHNGAVQLTSELGRGTTFAIYLPALSSAAAKSVDASVLMAPSGRGERILFVDDEETLARLGSLLLSRAGYSADGESQVLKALARLEKDPYAYDLVITDQTMPALSGLEFATRIHALRPELPVIIMSGNNIDLTPDRILAAGVKEVLAKPYNDASLLESIYRQLPRKSQH